VILVGAGFGDKGDQPAASPPEFGFEAVSFDGELRDGVERRRIDGRPERGAGAVGVAGRAIQHDAERAGLAAADTEVLIAAVNLGSDPRQIEGAAHVARDDGGQTFDHDVGHGVLDFGIVRLQLGNVGCDLDRLAHGADFQCGIEADGGARFEPHIVVNERLEAAVLDADTIRSHGEGKKVELTRVVGYRSELDVPLKLRGGQRGAGDIEAADVGYGADNGATIGLGCERGAEERE